jgi:hypothetical protein
VKYKKSSAGKNSAAFYVKTTIAFLRFDDLIVSTSIINNFKIEMHFANQRNGHNFK